MTSWTCSWQTMCSFKIFFDLKSLLQREQQKHQGILRLATAKGGFKSEGKGGFSQLPKMSAKETILRFKK